MNRMNKIGMVILPATALTVALFLGGCSSGNKAGDTQPPPAPTVPGTKSGGEKTSEMPTGWKTLASQAGNFELMIPLETKNTTKSVNTKMGPVTTNMITASTNGGKTAHLMMHVDYPAAADKMKAQTMLDNARDGAMKKGRKLVSEKQIELNGFPGRSLVATGKERGQDVRFDTRVFLVNRRLYQMVVVSVGGEKLDTTEQFFDSFKLLKYPTNTRK